MRKGRKFASLYLESVRHDYGYSLILVRTQWTLKVLASSNFQGWLKIALKHKNRSATNLTGLYKWIVLFIDVRKHMKLINFSSSLLYRIAHFGLLRNAILTPYKLDCWRRKNHDVSVIKFCNWSFEETAGVETSKEPFSSLLAMTEGKRLLSNPACVTLVCLYKKPSVIYN